MSLRILCAGLSEEERERAEAALRTVIGPRTSREPWTVSLVKLGVRWSIALDGPQGRVKSASFVASEANLPEAIAEAIEGRRLSVDIAEPSETEREERRDPHECARCRRAFVVVYEAEPDEPEESVPVACPHCWQIEHVTVARSAGLGRDYRADRT